MFSIKSNELEIAQSLQANMSVLSNFGEVSAEQKRGKALQKIAMAANLLDEVGFENYANQLSSLLEKFANQDSFEKLIQGYTPKQLIKLQGDLEDAILRIDDEYELDIFYNQLYLVKRTLKDMVKDENLSEEIELNEVNSSEEEEDGDDYLDYPPISGIYDKDDARDSKSPKSIKQMENNYKTKGWTFNADDGFDTNDVIDKTTDGGEILETYKISANKSGLLKLATSEIKALFVEYEKYIGMLLHFDLKYDEFPNYPKDITNMFAGYLKPDDIKILINYATAIASKNSNEHHHVSIEYRNNSYNENKQYLELRNKIFGKLSEPELPSKSERLNKFKTDKNKEKAQKLFEEMKESGDFTNYDEYEKLMGIKRPASETTPIEDWDL